MPVLLNDLLPLVGTRFEVQTSVGPVALQLAEVEERPRRGLPARFLAPLSLLFRSPVGVQLAQDTYRLSHPGLGSHEWALVPVGPPGADHGGEYEALLTQLADG